MTKMIETNVHNVDFNASFTLNTNIHQVHGKSYKVLALNFDAESTYTWILESTMYSLMLGVPREDGQATLMLIKDTDGDRDYCHVEYNTDEPVDFGNVGEVASKHWNCDSECLIEICRILALEFADYGQ